MVPLLLFVAFIAVATGLLALSQATLGVGILVVACFIAIVARIGQVHQQHLGSMALRFEPSVTRLGN